MGKIIVVANQKGGIGKTTTAVNLSMSLNYIGKKTLLIDLDQQANSTDTYKAKIANTTTIYDVLVNNESIISAIQKTPYGDVIAGDPLLANAEKDISGINRQLKLKKPIQAIVNDYDFIIIDTPPNLGIMLINGLSVADYIIVPVLPDRYSTQGLQEFFKTIDEVKDFLNPQLCVLGILIVRYDERTNLSKEFNDMLPKLAAEKWNTKVFDTKIHNSIAVQYSQIAQSSMIEYDPSNIVALDYAKLTKEIIDEVSYGKK